MTFNSTPWGYTSNQKLLSNAFGKVYYSDEDGCRLGFTIENPGIYGQTLTETQEP